MTIEDPKAQRVKEWWTLCNLYTITDKAGQLVAFVPNLAQRLFYFALWWCNYVLKSRQHGFSTFVAILFLNRALFNKNWVGGIIDFKIDDAKKKLAKIRLAYMNLDNEKLHPLTWKLGAYIKQTSRLTTDSKEELAWSNGSIIYCGTSLRGGTAQGVHISEYGKIANKTPAKAEEIRDGAFNAVHANSVTIIETTHEGGRFGEAYRLCKAAMDNKELDPMTRLDWRFHFFAWWQDDANELEANFQFTPDTLDYFAELLTNPWIVDAGVTAWKPEKMAWYQKKRVEQGHAMLKEHPSVPEEAFQAMVTGAIYGAHILSLRAKGHVYDFESAVCPFFAFWDIGMSDSTAIWLCQFDGREILVLDWHENNGCTAADYANVLRGWERKYASEKGGPVVIAMNFLPHDANQRSRGTGKTYVDDLKEAGITSIRVVPRSPDIWPGINAARALLPRCYFHKTNCDTPRIKDGRELPSGLGCLEAYRTRPADESKGGILSEEPIHDESSHSADAFRTMADAFRQHMIDFDGVHTARIAKGWTVPVDTGVGGSEDGVLRRDPFYGFEPEHYTEVLR